MYDNQCQLCESILTAHFWTVRLTRRVTVPSFYVCHEMTKCQVYLHLYHIR